MAYRNGTYVAFHAEGSTDPTASDIKYYRLLMAWQEHEDIDFEFVNSHDKVASVRDTSKRATLERSLRERLNNSKNMLLLVGDATKDDADWVPFEIRYAVDVCEIPIIAAYTGYDVITEPAALSYIWPTALSARINDKSAKVIHIPFRKEPVRNAVKRFDFNNPPKGSLVHYTREAHQNWGLIT